ncbi:uncharacterized protein LOC111693955 [Trichogramma pretiosum]|uniref:uncharacterized protein LOC111693955 n=1 Tax=Trichogramma pretiosum TaxID=7493 RepID=UPI000C71A9BF|nr:uncharacterized protein LOC111693955 [Trichogramma pretiosum]
MAPRDRRSDDEARSYDQVSLQSRATTASMATLSEKGQQRSHADDRSTIADEQLPIDGREEAPRYHTHEKYWAKQNKNIEPSFAPYNSWQDLDREDWGTLALIGGGFLFCIAFQCWWLWHRYFARNREE